jgi:hypothetical protein
MDNFRYDHKSPGPGLRPLGSEGLADEAASGKRPGQGYGPKGLKGGALRGVGLATAGLRPSLRVSSEAASGKRLKGRRGPKAARAGLGLWRRRRLWPKGLRGDFGGLVNYLGPKNQYAGPKSGLSSAKIGL